MLTLNAMYSRKKYSRIRVVMMALIAISFNFSFFVSAKLADRGRYVNARKERSVSSNAMNSHTNRLVTKNNPSYTHNIPIEGPKYRGRNRWESEVVNNERERHLRGERELNSQLTGCCTTHRNYDASTLCSMYGEDCSTGQQPSHDSGDESCEMEGLSFIGISFSVNTASGNPYSYQLCDQFPMENIIDRNYDYVMSMDEDGWLVGGGYKSFDFSGKMPYIDSSHTELLRIGSLDPDYGGTTIDQVYKAMSSVTFPPFSIFPEYVKGGGGHHSSDDDDSGVPSSDVTLIVSVVETYDDDDNYSDYEQFLENLFNAMYSVSSGGCMDDHDTDPHVSMARGVKFMSSYHASQYFYTVNLEVAVWQALYPKGVVIGSSSFANFPPNEAYHNQEYVGYGNLYFFFDRANITKAFRPNRDLSNVESYYSTLWQDSNTTLAYYQSVTTIDFDYSGSGSGSGNDNQNYKHNPYAWNAAMAKHDMTDGWDLPPNCNMEGETFFGIPLSRASGSKLQSTTSFQDQFDFEYLIDRNYTYMQKFGTNHGWLNGEILGNGPGSLVDKDTSHIPIFYTGTTNPEMGGISLSNLIKIAKEIDFGTLYIKPAFLFQDDDASIKLQFEADATSALAYLYDNLCKMIGLPWNYAKPSNDLGIYTNCAMHAAGDRAAYGCGPDNGNSGGFCPQMTLAYRVGFQSEDHGAAFFEKGNEYVDYWRSLYPSGVAVGTSNFCPDGGCLGLFLNRYDLYEVFRPDLGGSWVEYNGGTFSPTISPAPTWAGGCDDPHNRHLDKCFRKQHKRAATLEAWDSLGIVGQFSLFLVSFMAMTLSVSIAVARARKKRRRGESYMGFFLRDFQQSDKRRKKKLRKRKIKNRSLEQDMLNGTDDFDNSKHDNEAPPPRKGKGKVGKSSRERSMSSVRISASLQRSRSSSMMSSQGHDDKNRKSRGRSRSERSRSRSRALDRGRSRGKARVTNVLDNDDNRRQLV